MILRLLHAGKAGSGPLLAAAQGYRERVARYTKAEEVLVAPARLTDDATGDRERGLAEEAARLLTRVGPRDRLVALVISEAGWSSEKLASRLQAWQMGGHPAVALALGGPWGLPRVVVDAASERWAFGPLTLPHDLARVVCWEQLYRAFAILRGEPYHK